MKLTVFLPICAVFLSQPLFAAELCPEKLVSPEAVVRCAEERSPDIQRARLRVDQAKAQVGVAGQWQNPEISAESVHGRVDSETSSETEFSLGIPIELGGKISARKEVAQGGVAQAEAALFQARSEVRALTLLKLHRLRQLIHEREVIEESISTFTKLVSQFARRPKLSPEQEVSASVFRMVKSEFDLKKAEVQDQLASLDSYFKLTLGVGSEALKGALPQSPKSWPEVDPNGSKGLSPQSRLLAAELRTAQAEVSLAQSESWPTVTLGPSIKLQSEAGRSYQLYGFNLSLPLPLFNLNGAGREAAAAGLKLSETRKNLGILEEERRREELFKSYKQSVAVLATTLSHQEIEKKHSDAERLFLRGIVPSSLIIEAHRTYVELEASRNERELKALEALYTIYALDGKNLEVNQ